VITSEQGSGKILISNSRFGGGQIILDMSAFDHPLRISEHGDIQKCEDADSSHHVVWVNLDPKVPHGPGPGGDFYQPFQRLGDAQKAVLDPGVIKILSGASVEPNLVLSGKRMTLQSFGSGAVIRGK
jgi:hypothetical protein